MLERGDSILGDTCRITIAAQVKQKTNHRLTHTELSTQFTRCWTSFDSININVKILLSMISDFSLGNFRLKLETYWTKWSYSSPTYCTYLFLQFLVQGYGNWKQVINVKYSQNLILQRKVQNDRLRNID